MEKTPEEMAIKYAKDYWERQPGPYEGIQVLMDAYLAGFRAAQLKWVKCSERRAFSGGGEMTISGDESNAYYGFELPKDVWQWTFVGVPHLVVRTPTAPCWFHRLMQKIILGISWKKL